jgi:hypothetical protein
MFAARKTIRNQELNAAQKRSKRSRRKVALRLRRLKTDFSQFVEAAQERGQAAGRQNARGHALPLARRQALP